jgi:hypothetical protein
LYPLKLKSYALLGLGLEAVHSNILFAASSSFAASSLGTVPLSEVSTYLVTPWTTSYTEWPAHAKVLNLVTWHLDTSSNAITPEITVIRRMSTNSSVCLIKFYQPYPS